MLLIFIILFFLLLSAFFSGSEIAFISANKLGIAVKKDQKSRAGQIIHRFYERPERFLSTMLVGNNIALVAFTYFTTLLLKPYIEPWAGDGFASLLIYTLIITLVVLIFGEFLPKTRFSLHANKALFILAYPLAFFKWFLAFPTWMMTGLSNFILKRIVGLPIENQSDALTRLDLEHYIADTISDDHDDIDKEILTNALNLGHLQVSNCMVPRTEIVSIDKTSTIAELIEVFRESKLSRIIVVDGDADNVEGYVHHQQLLENPPSIKKVLLDIPFVPDVMNLKDLMLQFIKSGSSIACVVDEFGGTAGIITLEDILEEIFGEIEDEHDQEDYIMEKVGEGEYLLSGRLEIDFINDTFPELELPEGEYQTLSGYIVMTSEGIPLQGEQVELENKIFKIVEEDDTKIELVRVIMSIQE
ncbi:MAG: HlyC/CorC family transporter [Saprospiraceae bacterium]|nr:HlyC/CorC family transporter [Saprospiraceae bacterium]